MDGLMMVNWSGQSIPSSEMLVMRRVAVMMRTVYGASEVTFSHDVCAGLVRFEKAGVYGAIGGLFFFGDFGAKNNTPNTVVFFIPRFALHRRLEDDAVITKVTYELAADGSGYTLLGYPEDVPQEIVHATGQLKIQVRKAE